MTASPLIPVIALVGRPNVGKSSLFNRLTRTRDALVDATPGLTRDRQYGLATAHDGRKFRLVDTGGFEEVSDEPAAAPVRIQSRLAVEEADAVVLVTDARAGLLADDWLVADLLRRSGKPVICAVNKAEGNAAEGAVFEFHRLGLEPVVAISAAHGLGIEELLAAMLAPFPLPEVESTADGVIPEPGMEPDLDREPDPDDATVRTAVVGCPNAGKSTLINRLLGREQLVVSEQPGTTRDSIDVELTGGDGKPYILVDTAGIRRKSRISLRIEKYSVIAALKAMDRAQVAVLTLDAGREISDQDKKIANLALDNGCGLVLVANKWDLVSGDPAVARRRFQELVVDAFPTFHHAPLVFLSSHSGQGVQKLLPEVRRVFAGTRRRVTTGQLNRWLAESVERHPPARSGGRLVKIRFATQVAVAPPTFLLFTNHPDGIQDSYKRYLDKRLRDTFDFAGVPLRMIFRKGSDNPYV